MPTPLKNLYRHILMPILVVVLFSVVCFLLFLVSGIRGNALLWLGGINALLTLIAYGKVGEDSAIKSLLQLSLFAGVPLLIGLGVWVFWGSHQEGSTGATFSIIASVVAWVVVGAMWSEDWRPETKHEHLRGTRLITLDEAKQKVTSLTRENDTFLHWGGLQLPAYFANSHFLVAGMTRSGKTTTINFLLKTILPQIRPGTDTRALIYDPKNDLISTLEFLDKDVRKIILNPFDARCSAWDIAKDITAPEDFQEIAQTLFPVPEKGDRHNFFDAAAANLLEGVLLSLYETRPGEWTLRDAFLAMSSRKALLEMLALAPQHNETRIEEYFGKRTTSTDIISTIANKLAPYKVVASYWHHAETRVSLEEWTKSESVLIMANSNRAQKAVQALNRVMFKRLSQILNDFPEAPKGRTWVILDELAMAGRLEGLDELLAKGRSKGVSVLIAFQNLSKLQDVYGEKVADAITGEAANKAVLYLNSPVTAQWAERTFGMEELSQTDFSKTDSQGPQGNSTSYTTSTKEVVKPIVMGSDLSAIDPLDHRAGTGITGYFLTPGIGAYKCTVELDEITKELGNLEKRDRKLDYVKAPSENGFLKPWSKEEYIALGLTVPEERDKNEKPKPPEDEEDHSPDLRQGMDYDED